MYRVQNLPAKALVRLMNDGSSFLLSTTVAYNFGLENSSTYASSKAAVRSVARVLSRELAPKGVRVNTVAPGAAGTGFSRDTDCPRVNSTTFQRRCWRKSPSVVGVHPIKLRASPRACFLRTRRMSPALSTGLMVVYPKPRTI